MEGQDASISLYHGPLTYMLQLEKGRHGLQMAQRVKLSCLSLAL